MHQKPETTRFYRKRLPHWEVANGRYFVTIRLKGAIPEAGLKRIRRLRQQVETAIENGQDGLEERRAVFREMENWLDEADTADDLVKPGVAEMLKDAIEFREQTEIWEMFEYVIMPNHIHLFFRLGSRSRYIELARVNVPDTHFRCDTTATGTPIPPLEKCRNSAHLLHYTKTPLEIVLHNFKRHTGRKANRILGRKGQFWQREWFDHWSRSPEEDIGIEKYIRNNPVKARLVRNAERWPYTK